MRSLTGISPIHLPLTSTPHDAGRVVAIGRQAKVILGTCIAAALLIAASTIPARGEESIWTHNGSTVRWVSSGQDRWLYYLQPRPELLLTTKVGLNKVDNNQETNKYTKSLGDLRLDKKTKTRSPDLTGKIKLHRKLIESSQRQLNDSDEDRILCSLAAWVYKRKKNSFITVEISTPKAPKSSVEDEDDGNLEEFLQDLDSEEP